MPYPNNEPNPHDDIFMVYDDTLRFSVYIAGLVALEYVVRNGQQPLTPARDRLFMVAAGALGSFIYHSFLKRRFSAQALFFH